MPARTPLTFLAPACWPGRRRVGASRDRPQDPDTDDAADQVVTLVRNPAEVPSGAFTWTWTNYLTPPSLANAVVWPWGLTWPSTTSSHAPTGCDPTMTDKPFHSVIAAHYDGTVLVGREASADHPGNADAHLASATGTNPRQPAGRSPERRQPGQVARQAFVSTTASDQVRGWSGACRRSPKLSPSPRRSASPAI